MSGIKRQLQRRRIFNSFALPKTRTFKPPTSPKLDTILRKRVLLGQALLEANKQVAKGEPDADLRKKMVEKRIAELDGPFGFYYRAELRLFEFMDGKNIPEIRAMRKVLGPRADPRLVAVSTVSFILLPVALLAISLYGYISSRNQAINMNPPRSYFNEIIFTNYDNPEKIKFINPVPSLNEQYIDAIITNIR